MAMGTKGMAEMAEMSMPLPANTLPMMTGQGPFGNIEMGGMFTVVKVREGLEAGDYRDPGWYKHPPGTVAYEVDAGMAGDAPRQSCPRKERPGGKQMPGMDMPGTKSGGITITPNPRYSHGLGVRLTLNSKGDAACVR